MAKKKRIVSKTELYSAMANLNQNVEAVLGDIQSLLGLGVRHELVIVYQNKVEELRSWINSEILEIHFERELRDWAKFGKRVRAWERRDRNPENEMPIVTTPSQSNTNAAVAGKKRRQVAAS
jgi:hypothetical protein